MSEQLLDLEETSIKPEVILLEGQTKEEAEAILNEKEPVSWYMPNNTVIAGNKYLPKEFFEPCNPNPKLLYEDEGHYTEIRLEQSGVCGNVPDLRTNKKTQTPLSKATLGVSFEEMKFLANVQSTIGNDADEVEGLEEKSHKKKKILL